MITKQQLLDFEKDIADTYSEGKIMAPVHLTGSINGEQEEALIKIFKKIKDNDWVFSTHRSHYHALLKSNNPEWVKSEILAKRSININSKKHKIFTSAIVGGNLPIALGVAMALKRKKSKDKVYCFTGDMASEMGVYWEGLKYAENFDLPITFIIEDNGFGVNTKTEEAWGKRTILKSKKQIIYNYTRKYPHYGINKWVTV